MKLLHRLTAHTLRQQLHTVVTISALAKAMTTSYHPLQVLSERQNILTVSPAMQHSRESMRGAQLATEVVQSRAFIPRLLQAAGTNASTTVAQMSHCNQQRRLRPRPVLKVISRYPDHCTCILSGFGHQNVCSIGLAVAFMLCNARQDKLDSNPRP